MRIIFFGTGSFAVPALERLAQNIVLVVAQPDRPSGRGMKLHGAPTKIKAHELGLQVATPEKARTPEFVDQVRAHEADFLLVASYGQILSQSLLDSAKNGGINLHGSILPKYRGAAPIQRCIQNGDAETGITLMQMDKGMDTGDMISIVRTPIGEDETSGELQDRLALMAADLAEEWAPRLSGGNYPRQPQNAELATNSPKVEKVEAELNPGQNFREQYDTFRAFTPSPGAFLRTNFGLLKITQARRNDSGGEPGTILAGGSGCLVAFQGGSIDLIEVQPEGKKRTSGRDFLNGARLKPGTSLQ